MMTSSTGNIFRVTGPLCGEFTRHWWIPRTKASGAEFGCFLWSAPWINDWVNNRETGDLRLHRAHYDVIVMFLSKWRHFHFSEGEHPNEICVHPLGLLIWIMKCFKSIFILILRKWTTFCKRHFKFTFLWERICILIETLNERDRINPVQCCILCRQKIIHHPWHWLCGIGNFLS